MATGKGTGVGVGVCVGMCMIEGMRMKRIQWEECYGNRYGYGCGDGCYWGMRMRRIMCTYRRYLWEECYGNRQGYGCGCWCVCGYVYDWGYENETYTVGRVLWQQVWVWVWGWVLLGYENEAYNVYLQKILVWRVLWQQARVWVWVWVWVWEWSIWYVLTEETWGKSAIATGKAKPKDNVVTRAFSGRCILGRLIRKEVLKKANNIKIK